MDIQFFNGSNHEPQPRENIKIESVNVTPYPDGQRLHIQVDVTPFRERPNLMLVIHNENDDIVSELNIIETMHFNMEFTMHLRGIDEPEGAYSLTAELFYETRTPPQDRTVKGFIISLEEA
ncbi:MAG: hypothetical protein AAF125_18475 [Chloroflexota bacterium]